MFRRGLDGVRLSRQLTPMHGGKRRDGERIFNDWSVCKDLPGWSGYLLTGQIDGALVLLYGLSALGVRIA